MKGCPRHREHCLNIRRPQLFNTLPVSIRNIAGAKLEFFKKHFDYLIQINRVVVDMGVYKRSKQLLAEQSYQKSSLAPGRT